MYTPPFDSRRIRRGVAAREVPRRFGLKMRLSGKGLLAALVIILAVHGCGGGGGSPTAPAPVGSERPGSLTIAGVATPTPTPASAPTPAPEPNSWVPPGLEGCTLGFGSIHGQCGRQSARLLAQIDVAIDRLVAAHPELFNTNDAVSPGAYKVLNHDGFYSGVLETLRSAGLCADFDGEFLHAKNSNDFSERFDLLLSSEHIRRGDGSYRETCSPAAFPVDPRQIIHRIRVAFYGFDCGGRPAPSNNEGVIPVGCIGTVTATPKDVNNDDVDSRLHGPEIAWELHQDGYIADLYDYPNQPFNKRLEGISPGPFRLCATVQGIEGCLEATVLP